MYKALDRHIQNIEEKSKDIPDQRKTKLKQIGDFIRSLHEKGGEARLNFICTHNSRRSHLCQIWSATAAHYYGIDEIQTFSGGTEATAFNPRAVAALERAGFNIEDPGGDNPYYRVFFDQNEEPIISFSKTFDDRSNPQKNFAAVMTCSDADENCPFIPGASARFSIPYDDPKEADGTPEEKKVYDERCKQIAAEMLYLMDCVRK